MVPKVKLGSTDITISKVGLGGAMYESLDAHSAHKIALSAYHTHGINYFDGHANYGESEWALAQLKQALPDTIISTKTRAYQGFDEMVSDNKQSLFKIPVIDIYFFSNIDTTWDYIAMERVLPMLKQHQERGVIKAFGITSHYPEAFKQVIRTGLPIDVFMFPYNIVRRECEYLFPIIRKAGKGIILMKAFSAGEIFRQFTLKQMLGFYTDIQDWFDSLLIGVKSVDELNEDMQFIVEERWW